VESIGRKIYEPKFPFTILLPEEEILATWVSKAAFVNGDFTELTHNTSIQQSLDDERINLDGQ